MTDLLDDVERFHRSSHADRLQRQGELLHSLGASFQCDELTEAEDSLPFTHLATGVRFVAVPGGTLRMGLSDEDLAEASEYVDWSSAVAQAVKVLLANARPIHSVRITPFLCARTLLDEHLIAKITRSHKSIDSFSRREARRLVSTSGFRLPSEAEWEWIARDAGDYHFILDFAARHARREPLVSRFGITGLSLPQWVEDDWHSSYDGAPDDSKPWIDLTEEARGVSRSGFLEGGMQNRDELLFALAGTRAAVEEPCWLRLALNIVDR